VATKFPDVTVDGGIGNRISKTGGTNWVLDNFNLIQEGGGNILTENNKFVARQEFKNVVWTTDEVTGNG
tara:strand:+ start:667 stop:873 length:207 start_codon:yes stop_codon:yes gene_type:complete